MSTAELKAQLINKIQQSSDVELLENIGRIFEMEESQSYLFTAEQLTKVSEAQQEIRMGRSVTHEQMIRDTDEWLMK